ncbi:photosystem II q(b) protein [Gloeobacter morelensis]|uniref:Photosystem II q(B) protein n=1 Tax=Gloeobacter morelensis MG652769 TaxID=2781736 RepID=A0ABY3PNU2_9CYAN|nr:photosystem II q(b) protein [Gloeobacter morelensis]UFP95077.1 photosystem II q(b) protein [Gloeobacter morelensis MG652769]
MVAILERLRPKGYWDRFCNWVTSTDNRFYLGWFGVVMVPCMFAAAICFLAAIVAAPPVVVDGLGRMVSGSLLDGNNLITAAVLPTSPAIGLHLYPVWSAPSLDEWLLNGGPYQLIVLHFLVAVACYLGRLWEFSYRLGMRPWIAVAFSAPASAAFAICLIYPIGQGAFASGMPLGITGTFNWMLQLQAAHDILNHPLHMLAVTGVLGAACLCAFDGSVVTSSFVSRTSDEESVNQGYRFGQAEETYSPWAAYGFVGRLAIGPAGMINPRMVAAFLAVYATVGVWCGTALVTAVAFNLDGFRYRPIIESQGYRAIPTWADVVKRAGAGIENSMEPGTMAVSELVHRSAQRWAPKP